MKASPGSDILFIFVRTDTSPFLELTSKLSADVFLCACVPVHQRQKLSLPLVFDAGLRRSVLPLTAWQSVFWWTSLVHSFPFGFSQKTKNKRKVPRPSSHAIPLPHFGFSLLILEWLQPLFPPSESFSPLFSFAVFPFLLRLFPFPPPFHYWPRIFLNSLIWITPLCLTLLNG